MLFQLYYPQLIFQPYHPQLKVQNEKTTEHTWNTGMGDDLFPLICNTSREMNTCCKSESLRLLCNTIPPCLPVSECVSFALLQSQRTPSQLTSTSIYFSVLDLQSGCGCVLFCLDKCVLSLWPKLKEQLLLGTWYPHIRPRSKRSFIKATQVHLKLP